MRIFYKVKSTIKMVQIAESFNAMWAFETFPSFFLNSDFHQPTFLDFLNTLFCVFIFYLVIAPKQGGV